jgi:hypothetical protein
MKYKPFRDMPSYDIPAWLWAVAIWQELGPWRYILIGFVVALLILTVML